MSEYTPNYWQVIKIQQAQDEQPCYKVLAGYSGSYLHGQSWTLNSGIVSFDMGAGLVHFHGTSGSIYRCNLKNEGANSYLYSIYSDLQEKAQSVGASFEILPFDLFRREFVAQHLNPVEPLT